MCPILHQSRQGGQEEMEPTPSHACLREAGTYPAPFLFIILTTFLSCWLSIQLCPWLWSTWHWICTLKTQKTYNPHPNAHRSVRSHDYFWFPGWHLLWFRPWDHPDVAGYHRSTQILLGAQVSCSLLLCTIMLQQKSSSLPCLSSLFCPSSAISSTISSHFLLSSF